MNARTALMRVELAQLREAHVAYRTTSQAAADRVKVILDRRAWSPTQFAPITKEILVLTRASVDFANTVHDFLARADLIASEVP